MPSNQEDENSLDLQQYSLIFTLRWLVIAAVIGSVFGLSGLTAFRQKPIYEAEGKAIALWWRSRSHVLGMVVNAVTAVSGYSYYSSKDYYQISVIFPPICYH